MANNSSGAVLDFNDPCVAAVGTPHYTFWRNLGWYFYTCIQVMHGFGIVGNVLSLLAFRKQSKAVSGSYYHQLSIIVTDMLAIVFAAIAQSGYVYLYVFDQKAPDFIQKTYLLLFFAWCYPFGDMIAAASLVIMNGACADRLYALYRPVKYNHMPQKKLAAILFAVAYVVGITTNLHDLFVKKIVWLESTDSYVLIHDGDVLGVSVLVYLSQAFIVMRMVLIVSLFTLALLISRKYSKVLSGLNMAGAVARPVSEKALTRLLLAQSVLALLGIMGSVIYDVVNTVLVLPWCTTVGFVTELIEVDSVAIQVTCNFLIYISISKKFRQAVRAVLKREELVADAAPVRGAGARTGASLRTRDGTTGAGKSFVVPERVIQVRSKNEANVIGLAGPNEEPPGVVPV